MAFAMTMALVMGIGITAAALALAASEGVAAPAATSTAAAFTGPTAISPLRAAAPATWSTPAGPSAFLDKPEDALAVTLTGAKGDGVADDADAIQAAINKVQETSRKGVVFIPSGRYRVSKTVYAWNGIRLIGYGKARPVIVLGDNTPGFQEGQGKFVVYFCHDRPRAEGQPVRDGTPSTFYSGISNVNIEIGAGNPAACAMRFHTAQHCFMAHMDFVIGSGKCGIFGVGNEAEDLRFFGGEYGIITGSTPPSWPFVMMDARFEGQRKAAVQTDQNGMTLIRAQFKNVPTAVAMTAGRWESLWLKDCTLTDISGPALAIGEIGQARTKINAQGLVCSNVPVLAALVATAPKIDPMGRTDPEAAPAASETSASGTAAKAEPTGTAVAAKSTPTGSGADVKSSEPAAAAPKFEMVMAPAGAKMYAVREFCSGLQYADASAKGEIKLTCEVAAIEKLPEAVASDIPALPPVAEWVNVATLGAKGDNKTDNTAALKEAIAKHRVLYFPMGRYLVKDTLVLKADTVLVGFHPLMTQIALPDGCEGFDGGGLRKALVEAPKGGTCIMSGLGLDAGYNTRAVGAKWMAGATSLMDDVRFLGGHGTQLPDGTAIRPYNADRTGDPDPARKWGVMPPSLWITNGGGGTFTNIWSPASYAEAGVEISDTDTPGRMYAISVEHHVKQEVILRNVANWQIFGLQTEEERAEGPTAFSTDIVNCRNVLFGNLWLFRVAIPTPSPYGVKVTGSKDLSFRGVRTYSPRDTQYASPLFDVDKNVRIPTLDIGWLRIPAAK
jgi:hypothetical protein